MNILTAYKFIEATGKFSWRKVCKKSKELGTPVSENGKGINRIKSVLSDFGVEFE